MNTTTRTTRKVCTYLEYRTPGVGVLGKFYFAHPITGIEMVSTPHAGGSVVTTIVPGQNMDGVNDSDLTLTLDDCTGLTLVTSRWVLDDACDMLEQFTGEVCF